MLSKKNSPGSMLSQKEVFLGITNEMFTYWKRILYYNKVLEEQDLEAVTFDQLQQQLSKVSYSKTWFLKSQIKLCLKLCFFLLLLLSPKKLQRNRNVSLIYGLSDDQIFKSGKTVELLNFLQSNHVGIPLSNVIYVERKKHFPHKSNHGAIKVVNDVSLHLYLDFLTVFDRLKVMLLIIKRLISYSRIFLKLHYFFLIAVPYVIEEVLLSYISSNSSAEASKVVTTPSSIMNSEYIFQMYKKFGKRTMIWYSANSIPLEYLDSTLNRAVVNKQIYKYMPIDEHLVWTQDHRNYLKSVLPSNATIKVCGSLMFYLPKHEYADNKIYDILIFDVTPYNENKISYTNRYPDSLNSIYNSFYAIKFLDDIISVKDKILFRHNSKIKLALKPKRYYNSAHDTIYADYVNSLVKTKQLELISPETNLFEIIAQSKMCISYPFTSTAIIAKELKVPSLYYLENDILKAYNKVHGINFVDTKIGLLKFVERYVIEELK